MSQVEKTYLSDHRLAKLLVCILYIIIGTLSLETENPYIALVFGTFIWFFGINTAAYAIETLRGHCHQHQPI